MDIQYTLIIHAATENTHPDRIKTVGCSRWDMDNVREVKFLVKFSTEAEALTFKAAFPKSCKWTSSVTHYNGQVTGLAWVDVYLSSDGVNKGLNETGLKRIQTILKSASKLGHTFVNKQISGNSSPRDIHSFEWV